MCINHSEDFLLLSMMHFCSFCVPVEIVGSFYSDGDVGKMEGCIKEKFCEENSKRGKKESFNKELNRVPEN
jgi:hypothetical protein